MCSYQSSERHNHLANQNSSLIEVGVKRVTNDYLGRVISTKQLSLSSFHTGVANSANYDQLFVNIIIDVVCEDRGVWVQFT